MNCWHCGTELIWGCDHDMSDESDYFVMVTDLHCPNCRSEVSVYLPKETFEIEEENEDAQV
jgi:predicted RNA-binding Zn-ribbon protein involved in translation (DUF1610 family)